MELVATIRDNAGLQFTHKHFTFPQVFFKQIRTLKKCMINKSSLKGLGSKQDIKSR